MCLASVLKYSPRALKRIKNLIQGKQAYMIGGVTHIDELAVADELGVPLLGTEPSVVQLYGSKSGGGRIFKSAEVNMPPGKWDVYTLEQVSAVLFQFIQMLLFKATNVAFERNTIFNQYSRFVL